ncbi:MAG TPA: hypothetical protein VIH99_06655 [Bdellovibrionota bacterium]|jgi:hypothetical protein
MKHPFLLPITLLLLAACSSQPALNRKVAFVSKHATEAKLTFEFEAHMVKESKPTMAEAKAQVESQVQHMFGPMERAKVSAAPKEDHVVSIRSGDIEPVEDEAGTWRIPYKYEGTIVIEKGPRTKYDFPLPVDPTAIFTNAQGNSSHNPCTDEHYQSEGDFWYFWSPAGWGNNEYPSCKLRSNKNGIIQPGEDYEIVSARIDRFPSERATYPEYDRLADDNVIDVVFFYGKDEPTGSNDPYRSSDISAGLYRDTVNILKATGGDAMEFQVRKWSKAEIEAIYPPDQRDANVFVEEAVKTYITGLKLRVRLFFGNIGIDQKSTGFHYFFRDALKNSSVMVYNGHSGLGGNLDLSEIAASHSFRLTPNKNRYQIYFFNSCTSYTYYNTMYFNRKRTKSARRLTDPKGTKNLDILANGLSTAFNVMHDTDMALLKAIDKYMARGTWTSYQKLARDIDSDNLFTVNGDEDNPTKPR